MSYDPLHGARRFAAADKSDPFTLARALTHIRVGIATAEAPYDAREARETCRLGDGREYQAVVWREVRRP